MTKQDKLGQFLAHYGTLDEWSESIGITRIARLSSIRTGATMPTSDEIKMMARAFGLPPLVVMQRLRSVCLTRWLQIKRKLQGKDTSQQARTGRPVKI